MPRRGRKGYTYEVIIRASHPDKSKAYTQAQVLRWAAIQHLRKAPAFHGVTTVVPIQLVEGLSGNGRLDDEAIETAIKAAKAKFSDFAFGTTEGFVQEQAGERGATGSNRRVVRIKRSVLRRARRNDLLNGS